MQRIFFKTAFCLWLLIFSSTTFAQNVFKTTPASVIPYYEYVPQDYNNNSDKYPIVIFLHGIGERGPNTTNITTLSSSITEVAKLGPPMYVKNGTQFPFILISPQLKDNYGTWPSSYVMEVLDYVKTYLRIDERRIYITGLSLGGGGTWVAAQDYPELFAAIAPVCGGYNSPSKACDIAAENVPVWAFHGDADTTVPMSKTVNMVNAINDCTPAPSPLAKLTIYPNVTHSAWTKAYKTDHSVHNPNVYEWITSFIKTKRHGNAVPIASAGADKTVAPGITTLTGSATDADGSIASYSWTQMSGPNLSVLVNDLTKTLSLSSLIAGSYVFRFTVTDNFGNTDSDYIKVTIDPTLINILPTVSAGTDKTITLPTSSLSIAGTASDIDGTISTYAWTKVSGSTATLGGVSTATLSASNLLEGVYTFRLTVTDNRGGQKSDDVNVTVNPAPNNHVPTVSAGSDKLITLPTKSLTIVGSASDSDGSIASYLWTKVSGPAASMDNAATSKLWAYNLVQGIYTFRLTVTDNAGATSSDDMILTVNDRVGVPPPNIAPVANAGIDKAITLPTKSITIVGGGSDSDGTLAAYLWTQVSGPVAAMNNATTSKLWAYNLEVGTYSFKLKVTDDDGATAEDVMTLTVNPEPAPNILPQASAGPDKTITLPTKAITLVGSASDEDGTVEAYLWTQVSGPAAPMDKTTTSKLWAYNLAIGTYVFKLTVTDNDGGSSSDQMTLIVKDVTTSAASFSAEQVVVSEPTDSEEKVLGDLTRTQLANSTVVIFNGSGETIFTGQWTAENQNEVMNKKGLYIYNVVTDGRKTGSGKVYMR